MNEPAKAPTPTFRAHIVNMSVKDKITKDMMKLPPKEMIELTRGRVAEAVAKFLTKHFLIVNSDTGDGSVDIALNINLVVQEKPPGVVSTPIIFQEYNG